MAQSYSALGKWFEYLNADCDYEKWSQYLLNKLRAADAGPTGLDVGCGNGYFTRALNRAGYFVDGMDISPQMLTVARERAAAEGVRCEFLLGDITKLKVGSKKHFIIAVNDCINYVPKSGLKSAFARIYAATNADGIFLFDVSTEYKIRQVLKNETFCEDGERVSYIWFNEQTEDGVKMEITLFAKRRDGLFERFEETHLQYAHTREEIERALHEAGFLKVECEEHPLSAPGERLQFCARKR